MAFPKIWSFDDFSVYLKLENPEICSDFNSEMFFLFCLCLKKKDVAPANMYSQGSLLTTMHVSV